MTTQSELPIDNLEEPQDIPAIDTGVEAAPETPAPVAEPVSSEPSPTPVAETPEPQPLDLDAQRQQIEAQRYAYEQEQQRDQVVKSLEQEALQMEKGLMDQGLSEQEAQNQTFTHLKSRVSQIETYRAAEAQSQIAQGKRNASVHFAQKYNLGLNDIAELERANTPQEMESIAKTKSNMASKDKEIAELKARLTPQQEFDTNTPTPAASTNDDRLIDAYLNGDRSEAATAAAAKLLGM